MTDLIARLEKEGGSRELDLAIWNIVSDEHWRWTDERHEAITTDRFGPDALGNPICDTDDFTTSLDSAIALCKRVLPPNWQMEIFMSMSGPTAVALTDVDVNRYPGTVKKLDEIEHKSPATALCIALLRALEDGK